MMKALAIVFMITTSLCAQELRIPIQQDKLLHMGGSYVISSSIAAIVYDKTKDEKKAMLSGLIVSLALGGAKEIYDRKHGYPEVEDMLANVMGTTLGLLTIKITI